MGPKVTTLVILPLLTPFATYRPPLNPRYNHEIYIRRLESLKSPPLSITPVNVSISCFFALKLGVIFPFLENLVTSIFSALFEPHHKKRHFLF